ncbi:MAG: prepilin-type N-terminal cleavage/methylation domain-containing protein [Planctomycetota bacterium]|jgi:prepilin-type N-terminal cleavage/methylation domain-containing protein
MTYSKCKKAFTLTELLIALAITAMILAAVATAFNASVINYKQNKDLFRAVNSARQSISRITTQLRSAAAVDTNSPSNECTLITAASEDITYRYNSSDDKLYLVTNDDLTDEDYILSEDVTAMTFTKQTDSEGGTTFVKSMQISMTVTVGDISQIVSSAVVIRKNLD